MSAQLPPLLQDAGVPFDLFIQALTEQLDKAQAGMAIKARLGKQERANDTRRKVLLGALVLHRLESGKDEEFSRRLREWLKRELPDFLTRPGDKELFADLIANAPARETTDSAGGAAS